MDEAQQVIPYAGTSSPRAGLSPRTILAVFALLYAGVEYVNSADMAELLAKLANLPSPTGMMVTVQRLHMVCIGCSLAGAALLLAKQSLGGLVVAGAAAFRVAVVFPLLLSIIWSSEASRKAPPVQLAETVAGGMLAWATMVVSVWLVCRLAFESRRTLRSDGPDWVAVQRTYAWSILLWGVCQGLALAVDSLRFGSNPPATWLPYAVPLAVAAALLIIGGVGGALRQRWAWWLCIIAAAAWAIRSIVTSLLHQPDLAGLWFMLRRIDIEWIALNLAGAPIAVLWTMILCHPQVRGRWSASDSG